MEVLKMRFLESHETNSTIVQVWDPDININGEQLYVIISQNKCDGNIYTRFGNYIQMKSILRTYRYSLKEEFKICQDQ